METLIARTKILPPRHRPDLLTRPRLLYTLNELLETTLIILVAPAGYGKTYALMDLCETSDQKHCWYSVSRVDGDVSRFVAHFIAALKQTFPTFGDESKAALDRYSSGQDPIEQLVVPLVNELYAHVDEHFLFVVDDYHLVADDEEIGQFISQFVQHVDENCHLVLSSRTLLNLPDLPLLVARGLVAGLDYEDLAFRVDEVQTLVLQNYKLTLPKNRAADLVRSTEGWITGMILSAETLEWGAASRLRGVRSSGVSLYGYLAHQVLDQQAPHLRSFLLRSSVMDEIDAGLCEQVLLPEWLPAGYTWDTLIGELEQRNLFVMPVGDTGMALRYHHLFQEFLRDTLREELPTDEGAILQRLTEAYTARHEWEMAHAAAKQLDQIDVVVGVIERAGLDLVRVGRYRQVEQWLQALPPDVIHARPLLALVQGYCQIHSGDVVDGLALLSEAIARLEQDDGTELLVARALAYRSIAHRNLGDYDDSLADSERALKLLPVEDRTRRAAEEPALYVTDEGDRTDEQPYPVQEPIEVRAFARHNQGVSLQRMGQPVQGEAVLRKALADYEYMGDAEKTALTLHEIAVCDSDAGRHAEALRLYDEVLSIWKASHNVMGQALVLNSIGVHYHEEGDYLLSFEALVEAISCARRSGSARLEAVSLASLGDVYADLQMWQAAQGVYEQAYAISRQIDERFLLLYLELARAETAWSNGEWDVAYGCLDAAGQLVLDRKSSYEWGLYRLAMGRYYLGQKNAAAALEPFEDAARAFEQGGLETDAAKSRLFLAAATLANGDAPLAEERLVSGLRRFNKLELRHPLVATLHKIPANLPALTQDADAKAALAELLEDVATFDQEMPKLVRSLRRMTAAALPDADVRPATIVIRTLGRTEIEVDGDVIPISKWKTRVSRDLFLCFLAYPNGLTKEQIGLMFWPECSEQQLRTRFKNSIYRLRNAIGQEVIRYSDSLYSLDRSLDYDYDVEEFLSLIEESENAEDLLAKQKRLVEAIQLYNGDYAPDLDAEWTRMERERLRAVYLESALVLAELQFEQGAPGDALNTCQRLLSDDPCLEEVHRLAMRVHASSGDRAAIARQYAQCQQALEEELAVPPSQQTEELFALLMR